MSKLKIVSFNVNQFDGLYGHFTLYKHARYSQIDSFLKKTGVSTNAEDNFRFVLSYVKEMLQSDDDVIVFLHEVKKGDAKAFCEKLGQGDEHICNKTYYGTFRTVVVSNCSFLEEGKDFRMITIDGIPVFMNRTRKLEYEGIKIFGIHAPSVSQEYTDKKSDKIIEISPETFKDALKESCKNENPDILIGDFNPQADWKFEEILDSNYTICEESVPGGFNGVTAYTDKRLDLAFIRDGAPIKKWNFYVDYTPLKKKFSDHAAIILEIET